MKYLLSREQMDSNSQYKYSDLRSLSENEYSIFEKYQKLLNGFFEIQTTLMMVLQSIDDFNHLKVEYSTSEAINTLAKQSKVICNANRRLFNISVIFRFFIDQSEKFFSKNAPDKQNSLTSLLKKYYDGFYQYRFVYKLNNYIKHVSFPKLEVYIRNNSDLVILVNKENLRNNSFTWGNDICNDFNTVYQECICIDEIICTLFDIVYQLSFDIMNLLKSEIIEGQKIFNSFAFETKGIAGTPCIKVVNDNKNTLIKHFPIGALTFIDSFKDYATLFL